jgi:hypothetical protein
MNARTAAGEHSAPCDEITRDRRIPEQKSASARHEDVQSYAKLRQALKGLVDLTLPKETTLLVIARGDDDLLDLSTQRAWHFPRAINGKFAGCYPANSEEANRHLEQLRYLGAEYLVIPRTSFWWLEFYEDFTRHLQQNYRIVAYQEDVCIVYGLSKS